jgi:hypothetical protein
MQVFNAGFGGGGDEGDTAGEEPTSIEKPPAEMDPGTAAHLAEIGRAMEKNIQVFIGFEVPPVGRYTPDLAALRAASTRIVVAVGDASEGTPMYNATIALAEELGTQPVVFPGDYGGFGVLAESFAAKLHDVLARP